MLCCTPFGTHRGDWARSPSCDSMTWTRPTARAGDGQGTERAKDARWVQCQVRDAGIPPAKRDPRALNRPAVGVRARRGPIAQRQIPDSETPGEAGGHRRHASVSLPPFLRDQRPEGRDAGVSSENSRRAQKIPKTYFGTPGEEGARDFHGQVSPGDRLGRAHSGRSMGKRGQQKRRL